MKKSAIKELPAYFDCYINLNDDVELSEAFATSLTQIEEIDLERLKRIGTRAYADGKWSVNKIIQHLTDWERIWCYRTLLGIRNMNSVPPALDEEILAANSNADQLPIRQLIDELYAVRRSTMALFDTFDDAMLQINCRFSDRQMSALAMGFNIIGHQLHHFSVIRDRYFPLDNANASN